MGMITCEYCGWIYEKNIPSSKFSFCTRCHKIQDNMAKKKKEDKTKLKIK